MRTHSFVGSAILVGSTALVFVLILANITAHVSWFSPAFDVATFVILSLVAAIGATDTWVRADRRALPTAAGALVVGILWMAQVPVSSSGQVHDVLFALAQTGTPTVLVLAFVMSSGGHLARPAKAVGMVMSAAVLVAVSVICLAVLLAAHLPPMTAGGHLTYFGQAADTAGILPLVLALAQWALGARGAERAGDPMVGVWVLLFFESAASLGLHRVSAAGWMVLAALRLGAFVLITFGELRLFAISAQGERRRAEDLELLYQATSRIGSSLEPVAVASALAETVEAVVAVPAGATAVARVLQIDGSLVSVLTRDGQRSRGHGGIADSFLLDQHHLLAEAVRSHEPAWETSPVPRLVVPIVSGGSISGAVEVTSPAPARTWQTSDIITLIQGFAGLAALALANAEIFDDLQAAEAYNRAVLMAINDALISITLDGVVVGWNEHATALLGWDRTRVLGRDLIDTIIPDERRDQARDWLSGVTGADQIISLRDPAEFVVLHSNGSPVQVEINLWRVESGSSSRLCILVRDISARKAAEARLTRRATHDPLTQLPNRELLLDLLADDLAEGRTCDEHIGVIFIDLDHFKTVNDTHGHEVGDRFLASVATRLRRGVRPNDVVGRLSGDEFLVVCRNMSAPEEVLTVANRLRQVLAAPIILDDTEVVISASMGTSVGRPGSVSAKELIRLADQAMYRHKHSDRPSQIAPRPIKALTPLKVG